MAITRAQQVKQMLRNGGRIGFQGGGKDMGNTGSSTGSSGPAGGASSGGNYGGNTNSGGGNNNNNTGGGNGGNNYQDRIQRIAEQKKREKKAADERAARNRENKRIATVKENKRLKEIKEKREREEREAKEKIEKEKREKKDKQKAEAKRNKKTKQMQKASLDRFQRLEKYVDLMDDYGASGEDLAKATGFKGDIESGFEYDKDFFRDSKTGKIKDKFTEVVDGVRQFKSDAIPGYDFSINPVKNNFAGGLGTLTSYPGGVRPNDYGLSANSNFPSALKLVGDIIRPETGLQAFNTLEEARNIQDFSNRFADGDDSAYQEFEDYISRNTPTSTGGDGGNNNTTPIIPKSPIEETQEELVNPRDYTGLGARFLGSSFDFTGLADGGIARAGMMDGGMMQDTPEGGIMDLESGRQMYFLGKLVKKAKRAVKKIVKSPVGKAALLYFGGSALMGAGGGGGLSSFFGKGSFNPFLRKVAGDTAFSKLGSLASKVGMINSKGAMTLGGKLGLGLGVPFALDALGVGKEEDGMDLDEYYKTQGIDIDAIRNSPYRYLAPRFTGSKYKFADGGRIGYQEGGDAEPVAKKTMPLLDMDGMEKDYREDGGFVPIGRMERADDVPARLSKNEFVFTADAVRNAGEGDIDKGAEVMYNMMKNLESGGEVSEESQGLDGAREMFKTSQRLEEVL